MAAYNEAEFLRKMAQGDERAFTEIMRRHRDKVFGVALRIFRSRDLALEVVQEVFITVWTRRELFAHSTEIGGFCCTAARNKTIDTLRRIYTRDKAQYEFLMDQVAESSAPDKLIDFEVLEQHYEDLLTSSVDKLTIEQKRVWQLFNAGHSYQQIAEQLNITASTVKYHLTNARAFLRREIEPHLPAIIALAITQTGLLN